MVIAPANTGNDNNNKKAVMNTDQTNSGIFSIVMSHALMFKIVTIKLIAPNIELIPDKCKLNIAKSTAYPEWLSIPLNGGYSVHPVPAPDSSKLELNSKSNEAGNNQKLKLLSLG